MIVFANKNIKNAVLFWNILFKMNGVNKLVDNLIFRENSSFLDPLHGSFHSSIYIIGYYYYKYKIN